MKLSPAQRKVIDLMKEGWELHWNPFSRWFVRRCKLGRATASQPVKTGTGKSLLVRGVIEPRSGTPNSHAISFRLTEKGKSC